MPNNNELYSVTHSSPELNTVGEYLYDLNSPAHMYNDNPDRFLNIVGLDGLTNRQRIEASYKTPEEKKNKGKNGTDLPLKVGTVLYIEYEKVNKVSFATEGIEVVSTDEPAFKAAKLAQLEGDKGYVQVIKPVQGYLQNGSLKEMYPDLTVWIWCRAISSKKEEEGELQGEFFDLTPFVQSVNTNMGKNGGNFQITLPPLVCELDQDGKWVLKKSTLNQYEYDGRVEYMAEDSLQVEEDGELVTNKFLFHKIIKSNDLIFIRFETLEVEREQRYQDARQYFLNNNMVANRIYDMIGLVDKNSKTTTAANTDVNIAISGRDLSKLFIEDGTYFYALENSQGLLKFAGQSTQKNTQINRIFGDGALAFIGLFQFTSIEYILKFIIQQLANISIVPSDIFSSYAHAKKKVNGVEVEYDARNIRYLETEDKKKIGKYKQPVKKELANGIWQIIKLVIDESVTGRRLADSSMSTAQGSLLNFIRTACQEPLVEVYMDTYGDQYHLIVRKPPYDQKALVSLIEGKVNTENGIPDTPPAIIDIEAIDVIQEQLVMDDTQVYSWYHFFPKNDFFGDSRNYSLAYLGALYFEEYAQVFGSKAFQQSHPYIPFIPKSRKDNEKMEIYEKQAVYDMKYVVECNQYLPFTRKGTLILNGDKRIKIGNVIRYKPTGEIFFVEGVAQSWRITENGIERTTTVQVSRGMIEQLIYGVHLQNEKGERRFVSYFNIIDTRLELAEKEYKEAYTERVKVGERNIEAGTTTATTPTTAKPVLPTTQFDKFQVASGFLSRPELVVGVAHLERYNKYPENKKLFIKFINGITEMGYQVILGALGTNRTSEEQEMLWEKNHNNAEAGHSRHERGAAIDLNVRDLKTNTTYLKNSSEAAWRSTGVPALANNLGIRWGGKANNGTFGTYIDRVHFEIIGAGKESDGKQTEDIYEDQTKYRMVRGLDREGIFRNFKVNKFTFNFFLKNLQFDPNYRTVKSRVIYNTDQQGSLPTITVKATKK